MTKYRDFAKNPMPFPPSYHQPEPDPPDRWDLYDHNPSSEDDEIAAMFSDVEQGRYDDDPSPYDGTYSED